MAQGPEVSGIGSAGPPDAPDGNSYVAAASDASIRSRNILYFIVILILLTFTSIRNQYSPDWMAKRVDVQQHLYRCLTTKATGSCEEFKTRAQRAGYKFDQAQGNDTVPEAAKDLMGYELVGKLSDPDFQEKNKVTLAEIKQRIEAYLKKEIDEYTVPIPLLGSAIDINDLWLISGVGMAFLLYLFRASLEQESRIISYIEERNPQYSDLVVLGQVLSILSIGEGRFYKYLEIVLGLLPTLLYFYLLVQDAITYQISLMYLNLFETVLEFSIEVGTVALVFFLNLKCLASQRKVREVVGRLFARLP